MESDSKLTSAFAIAASLRRLIEVSQTTCVAEESSNLAASCNLNKRMGQHPDEKLSRTNVTTVGTDLQEDLTVARKKLVLLESRASLL